MKTLLFDVDGVLCDFIKRFTEIAHQVYGTSVRTTRQQPQWDWGDLLSKEEVDEIWKIVGTTSGWWRSLGPLISHETFDRINGLHSDNQVYFVTNRVVGMNSPQQQTHSWLRDQGIYQPNVIIAHSPHAKGYVARSLGADYSIEDNLYNAIDISVFSSKTKSYLINRRYNEGSFEQFGYRVNSVEEFLNEIEKEG